MSFPATHRAWLTRTTGGTQAIKNADVVLLLDVDVPWIPTKVRPSPSARIFHIDVSTIKKHMSSMSKMVPVLYKGVCFLSPAAIILCCSDSIRSKLTYVFYSIRFDQVGGSQPAIKMTASLCIMIRPLYLK